MTAASRTQPPASPALCKPKANVQVPSPVRKRIDSSQAQMCLPMRLTMHLARDRAYSIIPESFRSRRESVNLNCMQRSSQWIRKSFEFGTVDATVVCD